MADQEMSDADKIRLKRLAKLGNLPARAKSPDTSTSALPPPPKPAPKPAAPETPPKPVQIKIRPTQPAQPVESFEDWQEAALQSILQVTLDREAAERSSWGLVWLKSLLNELQDDGLPSKMSVAIADRLLLARLSLDPTNMSDDPEEITVLAGLPQNQTSFEYLVESWKRCGGERSKLLSRKGLDPQEQQKRNAALEEIRDLIVSYAGLSLQDSSMFPQPSDKPTGPVELAPSILNSSSQASTLLASHQLQSFLADLAKRFSPPEEDSLPEIIGPVIKSVAAEFTKDPTRYTMSGSDWQEPLRGLYGLSEIKPIAAAFTELPEWCPTTHAALFELQSLLGPPMRLACFPDRFPDVAKQWFPSPESSNPRDLETTMNTLRLSVRSLQETLFGIFNNIVKSSPKARESVLHLFAKVISMNVKRQGMQVDPRTVAGDGFMINLQAVLLNLAQPIIDATYSRIDKVDVDYFSKSGRFDMTDETRVHATQQEAKEYADQFTSNASPPNFITEIFFQTAWSLHVGYMGVTNSFNRLTRSYQHLEEDVASLEADRSWVGTPQEPMVRSQLERMKREKDIRLSAIYATQTHLLDPNFVSLQTSYSNFMMTWLVRLVDPKGQHPHQMIELPLPETAPRSFDMLPEFIFDDVIGFFAFISRTNPALLATMPLNDLLTFIIVFLSTPYLHNPYIKGKFVEILYYNTRRNRDNSQGILGDAINTNKLALKSLMPALMRIYVDIEVTGQHTQFYDKFNIRYYIAMIFRVIWVNPTHREALLREAQRVDQFVRFINLLINDTTFLMDESLSNLRTIREIEVLKNDPAAWNALTEEERKDKESNFKQCERTAKMDINLCNETVRLLKIITEETQAPFCRPEIVDRLAAMLNYNLNLLAGPSSQDLRVTKAAEYKWQPKVVLSDLLAVYLNLGGMEDFQAALARDGRSYSKELFDRADRISRRIAIKTDDELQALQNMVVKVEAIKAEDEAEEEMGEVPDEFLDPLTYAIMRDPVILPRARQSIDRSSIVQHLLSDQRCPFTSTPLKIEECLPDTELKSKIDEFVASRRAERLKNKMQLD